MRSLMPERIEALLAPDALHLRRAGAGAAQSLITDAEADAWSAPLAALDHALRAHPPRPAPGCTHLPEAVAGMLAPKLNIVLSEHFARWQLLPWQAEIESTAEKEAWARHSFREVYGEVSRHWQVRCAAQPPGAATPACAIDGKLLTALNQLAANHGCRLDSLRPLLVAAAERWQRKIPRGIAWFAVLEPGRLNLGLLHDRRWRALHAEPLANSGEHGEHGEQLAGLVARGAIAAGIAPGEGRLLLCGEGADTCPVPFPAGAVQRLGSALAWTTAPRELRKSA
jgi:hypothetical protein